MASGPPSLSASWQVVPHGRALGVLSATSNDQWPRVSAVGAVARDCPPPAGAANQTNTYAAPRSEVIASSHDSRSRRDRRSQSAQGTGGR